MESISQYLSLPIEKESKFNYEFQELGVLLQPIYGKRIWGLFHKVGYTEWKIKEAHRIATERGITSFGYLVGIIKRLP